MNINGIDLVTDRTSGDVEFTKNLIKKGLSGMTEEETETFLSGLKGAYNFIDFNRVEATVEYLANQLYEIPNNIRNYADSLMVAWDVLFDLGYDNHLYQNIEIKKDWNNKDILTESERERYLNNVYAIVSSFFNTSNLPTTLTKLTYSGANEIEKSLIDVYQKLNNEKEEKEKKILSTSQSWFFSGEIYGGEI